MATATKVEFFSTSLDLPESSRGQITELLNACLADTIELYTHAQHAHWNVKGPQLLSLHSLFEAQQRA